jgi:protein-lysine N-methyltransferase EEF2KMT
MERMANISAIADTAPLESAQMKTFLTYSLPHDGQEIATDSIFIEESPKLLASAGTTGHRTWDACLHLATYLTTEGRSLIIGKSVLELGVGTGLLSIICAGPLSAAYVLATDGDANVGKTILRNTSLNHHLSRRSSRHIPLEARMLEWGSSAALGSLLPSKGGNVLYDTILGADITYSLDSLEPLASTLSGLAELCPTADIVIAATLRNEDTFDLFLAHCLDHGLSVYDIDFRCPRFELQKGLFHSLDPPIRIVKIKKER